jgi:hypothetical protein
MGADMNQRLLPTANSCVQSAVGSRQLQTLELFQHKCTSRSLLERSREGPGNYAYIPVIG